MTQEPNTDVPEGMRMVDVSTVENRADVIFSEVKAAADHHDTLKATINCAFYTLLTEFVAALLAVREEGMPRMTDERAAYLAERIVDAAQVNLNMVLLIGEAAKVIETHRDNGELPKEYYSLFPDEIEAG